MTGFLLGTAAGLFIGTTLGVIVAGALAAGHRADDEAHRLAEAGRESDEQAQRASAWLSVESGASDEALRKALERIRRSNGGAL